MTGVETTDTEMTDTEIPLTLSPIRPDPIEKYREKLPKYMLNQWVHNSNNFTYFVTRPWLAYTDEIWDIVGGVTGLEAPDGDLQNDIDPLFHPDHFLLENLSDHPRLGPQLRPVLRLASRMLHSAPCMKFMRKVRFGHEIRDPNTGRRYIQYEEDDMEEDEIETRNIEVRKDLGTLSAKLTFVFGAIIPEKSSDDSQIHAIHYVTKERFNRAVFLTGERNKRQDSLPSSTHFIVINQTYREYFNSRRKHSKNIDIRTRFLLASTLIHEVVGHAFYARNRTDDQENLYQEPYYDCNQGDDESELGGALDAMLYGCQLSGLVDSHPDRGGALECWPKRHFWQEKHPNAINSEKGTMQILRSFIIFPIQTQWMFNFFMEKHWEALERGTPEEQLLTFHIPQSDHGFGRLNLNEVNMDIVWRRSIRTPLAQGEYHVEDYEILNEEVLESKNVSLGTRDISKRKWRFSDCIIESLTPSPPNRKRKRT